MKKVYQNTNKTMNNKANDSLYHTDGINYWLSNISYTIYEKNNLFYKITNEGHGFWKWWAVCLNNGWQTESNTKSNLIDIIKNN